jgi:hypothetical protein
MAVLGNDKPVRRIVMTYLNCPECGLSVLLRFPASPIEHCPRCVARRRRAVELYVSAEPPKIPRREPPTDQFATEPASAV